MQRPDGARFAVAIAVHDVAPATWRECREILAMLDDVAATPVSLLIVPHYHYGVHALRDLAFLRRMDARVARGDELVLHGYFHVDDAPAPRTPGLWFARRMLTRAEGEFAALDQRAAAWRLARGITLFERMHWPLAGFVPPAWLSSEGARRALAHCGYRFDYVTSRRGMFHLPEWRFERTANLCYSPDTILRRTVSAGLIRHALRRSRTTPLLRLSLHPQDARVPAVLRHWRKLVVDALAQRAPVTKRAWALRVRQEEAGPPRRQAEPPCARGDGAASRARAAS
jgi:predicted deacetylase